jgi:hypothetical protein
MHAIHPLPDPVKTVVAEMRVMVTYKRRIIELIVKNEQGRSKYVRDSKCSLSGDTVGFTESIDPASIVV